MNRTITEEVKKLLIEYTETRDSDNLLFVKIAEARGFETMPFNMLMSHLAAYNMPSFESVRRSRQKLQAAHPELPASVGVKRRRSKLEEDYKKYGQQNYDGTL